MSPDPFTPDAPPLEVYLLGVVPLDDALRLQRRLAYEVGEQAGGALILCEHPPAISVGRSGSRAHILPDDDGLDELDLSIRWVNRGGGVVLHLPGQLAAYLCLPLDLMGLSVGTYVDKLQSAILTTLAEFDLDAHPRDDAEGIYLGHARVASMGVAVGRWVTSHGAVLNVGPYLEPFAILDEPGHGGHRLIQTSMEARRQRSCPMAKVREALIRHVEAIFGLSCHHLYTSHPMIRREAAPDVHVASLR